MNLKHMHPASFLGLALHLGCMAIIQAGINAPEAAEMFGDKSVLSVVAGTLKILWFFIALQALALVLIALKRPFAIYLAGIAAIPNLPAAYIYFTGCAISHYAWMYAHFETAAPRQAGQTAGVGAYPFSMARVLPGMTTAVMVCGGLLSLFTNLFMGVTFIGSGAFLFYIQAYLKNRDVLAFFDDYFVYTPALFSKTIKIEYQAVKKATLVGENRAALEVSAGGALRILHVSSGLVAQKDRQYAINTLGHMLLRHNVPLV